MNVRLQKGFTIVELLVVVAIMVILTGIVTSNFAISKSKSRDAKRISDIVQIQLALELFFDRCNKYPAAASGIPDIAATEGCPASINLGTFISKIPVPPTAGDYLYVTNGSLTDYVIQAKLENNNIALKDSMTTVPSWATGFTPAPVCTVTNPYYYCAQPR